MDKTLSIIGQQDIKDILISPTILIYLLEDAYKNGYKHFLIGTLSNFDYAIYDAIVIVKKIYPDLKVSVLVNNHKAYLSYKENPLYDFNYIYYPLQEKILNDNIVLQGKYMIDNSDKLFCYFNTRFLPFDKMLNTAKDKNKEIYNLYEILNRYNI